RELGHEKDAVRYQEAARKYSLRAPAAAVSTPPAPAPPARPAPPRAPEPVAQVHAEPPAVEEAPAEAESASVQEFTFDVPDHLLIESQAEPAGAAEEKSSVPAESIATPPSPAAATQTERETDLSTEWEDMVSVEEGERASPAADRVSGPPSVPEMEVVPSGKEHEPVAAAAAAALPQDTSADKIQEIQFYISQEMWDAAKKAILDLTEIAPDAPEITQ